MIGHGNGFFPSIALVFLLTAATAMAAEPRPRPVWAVEAAVERFSVAKETDNYFMVSIPDTTDGKPVSALKAFYKDGEVQLKVLWKADGKLTVLVNATPLKNTQNVRIYPLPGEKPVEVGFGDAADPLPVNGLAARTGGMDFPETLAQLRGLEGRFDRPPRNFAVANFDGARLTFKDWFRGDWTRRNHWVRMQTWLMVPEKCELVFGLAGISPAWLVLDGKEWMSHPAGMNTKQWTEGKKITLSAGLHCLRVMTVCRQEIDTGVAWKHPDAETLANEVVTVTGGDFRSYRLERKDSLVHAFADADYGRPYRFAGTDELFIPCTLQNAGVSWGTNSVCRWIIDGKLAGSGETFNMVLLGSRMPQRVASELLGGGQKSVYEFDLSCDKPAFSEEWISSRIVDVPPICSDADRFRPMIRMRTTARDGLRFNINASVFYRDGSVSNITEMVTTDRGWARVYLGQLTALDVDSLAWTVTHAQVQLSQGRLRLMHEPYDVLPDTVSGETLRAGEDFISLVVPRASKGMPKEKQNAKVVESDAVPVLADEGLFMVLGQIPDVAQSVSLVDLSDNPGEATMTGIAWLCPFLQLKKIPKGRPIFYAPLPKVDDWADLAHFERRVAAMAGFMSSLPIESPSLVLVVPPPLDVLLDCGCVSGEQPCEHAADSRKFAEVVIRVADMMGVPTVDLYTPFCANQQATHGGRLDIDQLKQLARQGMVVTSR